jgi:hypothetical protein
MPVSITFDTNTKPAVVAAQLRAYAAELEKSRDGEDTDDAPAVPASRRGRPAKMAKPTEVDDFGSEETTDDDDFGIDDEPAKKEPTLDDVQKAFAAHKLEHGVEKLKKILARFNVKSIKDLKPAQYAIAIKSAKA